MGFELAATAFLGITWAPFPSEWDGESIVPVTDGETEAQIGRGQGRLSWLRGSHSTVPEPQGVRAPGGVSTAHPPWTIQQPGWKGGREGRCWGSCSSSIQGGPGWVPGEEMGLPLGTWEFREPSASPKPYGLPRSSRPPRPQARLGLLHQGCLWPGGHWVQVPG